MSPNAPRMHVIKRNSLIRIPACMQVGLAEMKPVVDMTGGMVVQTDTFHNPVFKESLKRVFVPPGTQGSLEVASNATFEVSEATLLAAIVLCMAIYLLCAGKGGSDL